MSRPQHASAMACLVVGLLFLVDVSTTCAQNVQNVRPRDIGPSTVEISYDLYGSPEARYIVALEVQIWQDNRQVTSLRPQQVFGDVGKGVAPGHNRIVWMYASERPAGAQTVTFNIEAFPPQWFCFASGFINVMRGSVANGLVGGELGGGRMINDIIALEGSAVFPMPYYDSHDLYYRQFIVMTTFRISFNNMERTRFFVRGGGALGRVTISHWNGVGTKSRAGAVVGTGLQIGLTHNTSFDLGYNIFWFPGRDNDLRIYDPDSGIRPNIALRLAF